MDSKEPRGEMGLVLLSQTCYYCYSCPLPNPDAWENHVIRHHPGQLAYPGSAPLGTVKLLEVIEQRERSDKMDVGLR